MGAWAVTRRQLNEGARFRHAARTHVCIANSAGWKVASWNDHLEAVPVGCGVALCPVVALFAQKRHRQWFHSISAPVGRTSTGGQQGSLTGAIARCWSGIGLAWTPSTVGVWYLYGGKYAAKPGSERTCISSRSI